MTEFKSNPSRSTETTESESAKKQHRSANKEHEIRERKKTATQTIQRQTQVPNGSNTNSTIFEKFLRQPRHVKFGIISLFASLIFSLIYFVTIRPEGSPSPFFRDFAQTTSDVFEEINSVDLPASASLTQHTVQARSAANMVQNSPAFKNHGSQIASGLRDFGDKITLAGRNLQNMYNKGSSVYQSFDSEIEKMMERLNSNQKRSDAKYFKGRLNKLITKVKDFRQIVEKTQSSIQNAEEIRHDTEGYIIDGLREAEKFINDNGQHVVDLTKTQKELVFVNELLGHLDSTAVHLDRIRKILVNYEDRLLDVEAELGNSGKEDDDIFEVTKEDLKFLRSAVNNLKASHNKFNKLSD